MEFRFINVKEMRAFVNFLNVNKSSHVKGSPCVTSCTHRLFHNPDVNFNQYNYNFKHEYVKKGIMSFMII